MSEDPTGSGLGGVSGGGAEGGASGLGATGGAAGTTTVNGGASVFGRLVRGTLPVHDHETPSTGGEIDYLRAQWGTDHTAPGGDPHPQYATDADLTGYLTAAGADVLFLTPAEGDARYAPAGTVGGVSSVNGETGAVVLDAADVGALSQVQADARYPLKTDPDPYPAYLTAAEGDARYPQAGASDPYPQYQTKAENDALYLPLSHAPGTDPHPQYLTPAEGDARYATPAQADVTLTADASLTATESPANTFALAVRLSPDAGNALALRANGLFGTDTTGGGTGLATDPLADAKGDLFAASGDNAVGRLPLGTNGFVLTADSTQTLGVKWADPATAGSYLPLTGGTLTGALRSDVATAGTNALNLRVTGDANPRFRINNRGDLEWLTPTTGAVNAALTNSGTAMNLSGDLLPTAGTLRLGNSGNPWQDAYATNFRAGDAGLLVVGTTNPAGAGAVRLRNAAAVAWRNAANGANLTLTADASDRLAYSGTTLLLGGDASLTRSGAGLVQVGSALHAPSGTFDVKTGTAPGTTRASIAQTGTLTLTPDAGQGALVCDGSRLVLARGGDPNDGLITSTASVELAANSGYWRPQSDNNLHLGLASYRLIDVWAVNGTVQTSSADLKEGITPLDPAAAMAAVRNTQPVTFDYRPPERPAAWYELPDDPEQAEAVLRQRLTAAPLEAGARHQAGFVLQDATGRYPTDPLFATGDGQSNAANTAGILLAALRDLDARLTALETP